MIFEKSSRTPLVEIRADSCLIQGECYPENIVEWSSPVLEALRDAMRGAPSEYKVDLELYYFNSSSAKFLFDFFEYLDDEANAGRAITINWRYRAEDDTMLEAGEDFLEDIEACKFELVPIENQDS
jgi:hypothetical protein